MGWHYRSPQTFPASMLEAMRQAAAQPSIPIAVGSFIKAAEAKDLAERYRWFRWCVRHTPEASFEMYNIINNFDVRTSLQSDQAGYVLYLTAKPTKVSEFFRLNPDLALEVLPMIG